MLFPACFLFFAAVVVATFKGEENLSESGTSLAS